MAKERLSIYERKLKSGEIRRYLIIPDGQDPVTKKYRQKWIPLEAKTLTEAKQERIKVLAEIQKKGYQAPSKTTIGQVLDQYIADCWRRTKIKEKKDRLTRRTVEGYESVIKNHIKPAYGDTPARKFTARQLRALILEKQAISQYTAKKIYIILNCALNQALQDDEIGLRENVCSRIAPPTITRVKRDPWSAEQALGFLKKSRKILPFQEYCIFLKSLHTGMRIGEVLGARWVDVNLKTGILKPVQSLEQKKIGDPEPQFGDLKTEASEAPILLTATLQAALKKLREEKLAAGTYYNDYGLIFTSSVGTPIHLENLRSRSFHRAIEIINADLRKDEEPLPKIRIHDLRHSAATILLKEGVPIEQIKRYLRHANVTTTEIYLHDEDDTVTIRNATQKMDQILGQRF